MFGDGDLLLEVDGPPLLRFGDDPRNAARLVAADDEDDGVKDEYDRPSGGNDDDESFIIIILIEDDNDEDAGTICFLGGCCCLYCFFLVFDDIAFSSALPINVANVTEDCVSWDATLAIIHDERS